MRSLIGSQGRQVLRQVGTWDPTYSACAQHLSLLSALFDGSPQPMNYIETPSSAAQPSQAAPGPASQPARLSETTAPTAPSRLVNLWTSRVSQPCSCTLGHAAHHSFATQATRERRKTWVRALLQLNREARRSERGLCQVIERVLRPWLTAGREERSHRPHRACSSTLAVGGPKSAFHPACLGAAQEARALAAHRGYLEDEGEGQGWAESAQGTHTREWHHSQAHRLRSSQCQWLCRVRACARGCRRIYCLIAAAHSTAKPASQPPLARRVSCHSRSAGTFLSAHWFDCV